MAVDWDEYVEDNNSGIAEATTFPVLIVVAIVISAIVIMWLYKRGRASGGGVDNGIQISEEERVRRRKMALQRFGDNDDDRDNKDNSIACESGDGREHHPLIPSTEAQQARGNLRHRTPVVSSPNTNPKDTNKSPHPNAMNKKMKKAPSTGGVVPIQCRLLQRPERSNSMDITPNTGSSVVSSSRNNPEISSPPPPSVSENKEKTIKRRLIIPPAQLLCEALSTVCSAEVVVASGEGTWGGEGWVSRKAKSKWVSASSRARIVLPLITYQSPSNDSDLDDEWERLHSALQSMTLHTDGITNPFNSILASLYRKGSFTAASKMHSHTHGFAARDIIDNIMFESSSKDADGTVASNKEGLGKCLSAMGDYLSKLMVSWLDRDVPRLLEDERISEESEDEDLFSNDYDNISSTIPHATTSSIAQNSALGELIELCSKPDASRVVSRRLLGDVIAKSSDGVRLSQAILQRGINRLPAPDSTTILTFDSISKDLAVVTHAVANSSDIAMSLSKKLKQELDPSSSGNTLEMMSILRPVLSLGGYTIPCVGFERSRSSSRLYGSLKSISAFPLGYFDFSRPIDPAIKLVQNEAQSVMRCARIESGRILDNCMRKKGGNGRDVVFSWLAKVVQANEMQANLLQDQLLDERDDVHRSMSSKQFLVGTALSVLESCCQDLIQAYEKKGLDAFDSRYLGSANGQRIVASEERRLVRADATMENLPSVYSGSTEFFFVASALLRVAVFPTIRSFDEYGRHYKATLNQIRQLARQHGKKSAAQLPQLPESHRRWAAAYLGWDFCLHDQDMMKSLVNFTLLQLRFLSDLCTCDNRVNELSLIPESMVKLPSQYIARIASSFQSSISPKQVSNPTQANVLI